LFLLFTQMYQYATTKHNCIHTFCLNSVYRNRARRATPPPTPQAAPPHNRAELFTGGADEEFLCGICLDILRDPHSCCKEGHTYCLTCITDALNSSKHCPICRQAVVGTSSLVKSRYLQNMIEKSTISCPHNSSSNGTTQEPPVKRRKKTKLSASSSSTCCSWQGLYKDLSKHLDNDCELAVCDCPLQGCSEKVKRTDLSDHQRVCPHRTVTCHRCETVYKTLAAESHEEVCPEVEIVCSNTEIRNGTTVDECKQKYKRKDAALHESICKLAIVDCVYAPLGCGARILRKDMNQHLVDKVLSHARISVTKLARVAATFEAHPSKGKKNVTWQVDWPLPEGFIELDSKKVAIGAYQCWLKLERDESGDLGVLTCAEAVQESECQFLFPASLKGSNTVIVHPSDEQKSDINNVYDEDGDIIGFGESAFGFSNLFTAAEALDFVSDGKLTINADIQIAPLKKRVSLN
jgi:hypothetical protein